MSGLSAYLCTRIAHASSLYYVELLVNNCYIEGHSRVRLFLGKLLFPNCNHYIKSENRIERGIDFLKGIESMLSNQIKRLAKKAEIDVIRITHADPFEGYLLPDSPRRDPHITLHDATSLVIVGVYIGGFRLPNWDDPTVGRVSRLFLSGFFNDVVKPLESIQSFLHDQGFEAAICDEFQSDCSILPLKLAAVRAGIGWQGKNTLMISRVYGSFLALGGLITDAPLEKDVGLEKDRCGICNACREACPTGALDEPYRLKRELCLSHLWKQDALPQEIHKSLGNKIIECEICQDVCPWNKKHLVNPRTTVRNNLFGERVDSLMDLYKLSNLMKLSETDYKKFIRPFRTAIPFRIFRRNVMVALGNSKLA